MSTTPPNFNQLIQACSDGDLPKVLELLPTTDPTWFKSAPLRTAAEHNHTEIVLALLPHSNTNAHDHQALKSAIRHHNDVLFEALFSLCTDCFTSEFYSIYATVYALWPEKLILFEDMEISQSQYDMALMGACYDHKDPKYITDLLSKTSVRAQKSAMKILLENCNYKLFDAMMDHSDPHNCVDAMLVCFDLGHARRAKKLFQRCTASQVCLDDKVLRRILDHAVERLDWQLIDQVAPLVDFERYSIGEKVVEHNDVDVYTYFQKLGLTPTFKSAQMSAKLGNKELTHLQINTETVTPEVLDAISANGWGDVLDAALKCMDNDVLKNLQHSLTNYGNENPYFSKCVRNEHYTCLEQILSHAFATHKSEGELGRWVFELACEFSSDPLLFNALSKNISCKETDQVVSQALRNFEHRSTHPNHLTRLKSYAMVLENLLPFASQKTRVALFGQFVTNCSHPPIAHAKKLAKATAVYIKPKDITPATQWWWDAYQAQKLNKKMSKMIGNNGAQGVVKKM